MLQHTPLSSKFRERAYLHATSTTHHSHDTKLWFDGRSSEIYSFTPEVSDTGIDVHPVCFNSTLSNSWLKTCVAVPWALPTQYFSKIICRQMQGTDIPSHRSCIQPFIHRHRCLVSTSLPFKDGSVSWIPSHCILPDYSLCDARLLWWKSMGVKSSRAESVGNLASPKRLVFRENHDLLMKLKGHISHTGEAYTDGSLLTGFR